jgi:drug/metabolite transporter (DMT)-like permease
LNLLPGAIGFALLSLLFSGVIDVIYKRYSRKERSRGMFLLGMGLVWGLLQFTMLEIRGQPLSVDAYTLGFGIAAGLMVTLSNLLFIESFTHLDVGLGSTIYRLNTIGVVVLSFLFLGEDLGPLKLLGITSGVAAALLLYHHRHESADPTVMNAFFWLVALASLMRAGFGVTTKGGLALGANGATMMLIAAACWVVGGFGYALLRERRVKVTAKKIGYAIVAGLVVFLVVNTLLAALERGEASIVVPIANLGFVVALGISVAARMERFSPRKGLAVVCASLSIILLSRVTQ